MSDDALILPDFHHKYELAQRIIDRVPHSYLVCLGDYWDDHGDKPADAFDQAMWLVKRMREHPEDEFVLGNHDISYLFGVDRDAGCGWSHIKQYAIENAVHDSFGSIQNFRKRFKLYTWVGDWLLTHAGLSLGVPPSRAMSLLPRSAQACMRQLEAGNVSSLIAGDGITWCREFKPIPGVKQLFGHTARPFCVAYDEFNWCIDTHMNHYAVISADGALSIHQA